LVPKELEYPELRESDEYIILSYRLCSAQLNSLQHVVSRAAVHSAKHKRKTNKAPVLVISYFEFAENYICFRRSGDPLKIVK